MTTLVCCCYHVCSVTVALNKCTITILLPLKHSENSNLFANDNSITQGSHASLKVLEFFLSKYLKTGLVLESPEFEFLGP